MKFHLDGSLDVVHPAWVISHFSLDDRVFEYTGQCPLKQLLAGLLQIHGQSTGSVYLPQVLCLLSPIASSIHPILILKSCKKKACARYGYGYSNGDRERGEKNCMPRCKYIAPFLNLSTLYGENLG